MRVLLARISLALTLAATVISSAWAVTIAEIEPNNTLATAQNVDGFFSLDFSPDIGDVVGMNTSTMIPHVTILGTGDNTFDYYSFTVTQPNSLGIFDIDHTSGTTQPVDFELFLFRSDGAFFAQNDNSPLIAGAGGSTSTLDPFIQHLFAMPGTYVIAVGRFNSIPMGNPNPGIGGTMPKPGDNYTLHISVPEPSTVISAAMGMCGLAVAGIYRRRRRVA
jgi:hypothetical protein